MRKYLAAILAVAMLVAFAGLAYAAEAEKAEKKESAEMKHPCAGSKNCGLEGVSKVSGKFKSVDKKKGELVVTGEDGKENVFRVKKLNTKGIKEGDKVEVTCVKNGEECFAKKIKKTDKSRAKPL